ncbi:unnamed protein product [Clonostachys byssicola]|uniref:Mid2 domain-containing protein n=1 Tax=Clonostachys byssicola TaxID=160290 RepID=A0A9N9U3I7_9HYPO|nr:unnamed protein product [Clonostachys byssicola]
MEDWRVVVRQDHGQRPASDGGQGATIQTITNPTSTAGGQGGQLPPSTTSSQAASVPTISTNYVKFKEDSIFVPGTNTFGGGTSDRIFVAEQLKLNAVDFAYSWEDSSFEPLNVSLIVVQNNNNVDRTNASSSSSSSSSSLSLTSGSIKFNYTKLTMGAEEGQSSAQSSVDGVVLALDMYWQSKGKSLIGHSYSPYFGILANAQSSRASALQDQITNTYGTNGDGRDADVTTLASPSSSSTNTASEGQSNPSSGGGGGGLSTGAIVGIAIGGAAGLAIIALVAWFLLRRRKSKSQIVDTHGASNAYIADKDSTAQSPQSPYADDVIHNPRADSSSLHNAHADNVPGPRDGSGTATPSGLSRNVAHLVEEGMTADDIARLEEEERQLDDEIERAASQAARR